MQKGALFDIFGVACHHKLNLYNIVQPYRGLLKNTLQQTDLGFTGEDVSVEPKVVNVSSSLHRCEVSLEELMDYRQHIIGCLLVNTVSLGQL